MVILYCVFIYCNDLDQQKYLVFFVFDQELEEIYFKKVRMMLIFWYEFGLGYVQVLDRGNCFIGYYVVDGIVFQIGEESKSSLVLREIGGIDEKCFY